MNQTIEIKTALNLNDLSKEQIDAFCAFVQSFAKTKSCKKEVTEPVAEESKTEEQETPPVKKTRVKRKR